MPLSACILFGAFGLLAAVYAGASLAGLVTPPWWERELSFDEQSDVMDRAMFEGFTYGEMVYLIPTPRMRAAAEAARARPGRELISVGVGAVGLAALAFAAFTRREKPRPPAAT